MYPMFSNDSNRVVFRVNELKRFSIEFKSNFVPWNEGTLRYKSYTIVYFISVSLANDRSSNTRQSRTIEAPIVHGVWDRQLTNVLQLITRNGNVYRGRTVRTRGLRTSLLFLENGARGQRSAKLNQFVAVVGRRCGPGERREGGKGWG